MCLGPRLHVVFCFCPSRRIRSFQHRPVILFTMVQITNILAAALLSGIAAGQSSGYKSVS